MRPSPWLPASTLLAALLLAPAAARAAPALPTASVREDNGTINVSENAAAVAQRLNVSQSSAEGRRFFAFSDDAVSNLIAGGDCKQFAVRVVRCPDSPAGRMTLALKAADDVLRTAAGKAGVRIPMKVLGGDGADSLQTGLGDDDLDGGDGDDVLDGAGGADDFRGGKGTDTADFSSRGSASVVRVTLGDEEVDGDLDDLREGLLQKADAKKLAVASGTITLGGGAPPPAPVARVGDNVHGDVENVTGGAGGDDLVGNDAVNVLAGGPGADTIEGKGGPDVLDGGEGDDLLVSRDGVVDTVNCGAGADRVVADPQDRLAADCERDDNGAAPGEKPGGAVAGTPPEAEIVTRVVRVSKRGVARLRVRCVYRAQRCRGPVKLVARTGARVRVGRRTLRIRAGQTLASVNVEIPWGTSTGVTLKVGSTARKVLARRRRGLKSRATARLTDSGSAAPAVSLARNVTVVG